MLRVSTSCDYSEARQGKFAPPGKPVIGEGARQRRKQSISPQTALWIAPRSLSSAAAGRDPLARKMTIIETRKRRVRQIRKPDGQISSRRKFLSSPARKNIPLPRSPKSVLSAKHTSFHGGAGRDRHERGVDAVDAAASGAERVVAGRIFLREQEAFARTTGDKSAFVDRSAGWHMARRRGVQMAVAADGKTVWSWHPLLVSRRRRVWDAQPGAARPPIRRRW